MTVQTLLPQISMTCFKAYDIRGRLGTELNDVIAWRIGRAFAEVLAARRVVVGRDCRGSSASLAKAVVDGLLLGGADVIDLGLCGTEEMYFATAHFGACGGIEITASHNPIEYNGMKMVGRGSAPLDPVTEMAVIRKLAECAAFAMPARGGRLENAEGARDAYVERVLSFLDIGALRPLRIVANAGNGAAGPTFDAITAALEACGAPLEFRRLHHEPDASFPNGIPNPLLPENQPVTSEAVVAVDADFGLAWDGDFDRCFFFDHEGRFVPGEYVVGLLAQVFLMEQPGATIVHDPRVIWNTVDIVARGGGNAHPSRTGHAFLKQALRDTGAIYGGEMSAHHYFGGFMACDSGMIPWLMVAELVGSTGCSLADLVSGARGSFPSSGEINFRVADPSESIKRVEAALAPEAHAIDRLDGLSLDFADWRMNLRMSNTEALLRLNVERRGNPGALSGHVVRVAALIEG